MTSPADAVLSQCLLQSHWVYAGGPAAEVEGGDEITEHWMFGPDFSHCDRPAAGFVVARDGIPVVDGGVLLALRPETPHIA